MTSNPQRIAVKFVEAGMIQCPIRHISPIVRHYTGRGKKYSDWAGQSVFVGFIKNCCQDEPVKIYFLSSTIPGPAGRTGGNHRRVQS